MRGFFIHSAVAFANSVLPTPGGPSTKIGLPRDWLKNIAVAI